MTFDPARFLAARVRALYATSPRATDAELREIAAARGYPVLSDPAPATAACVRTDPPLVVLGDRAGAEAAAHEAFHAWVWENTSLGIEYEVPYWDGGSEEDAAHRFAALLRGAE